MIDQDRADAQDDWYREHATPGQRAARREALLAAGREAMAATTDAQREEAVRTFDRAYYMTPEEADRRARAADDQDADGA